MGTGLRVEVVNREDSSQILNVVFHDLKIRIGRDAMAEVSLPYTFVTRWHAIVKLENGAILLSDIGSTNGTWVGSPPARIPPHHDIDLREHGMAFSIGPLSFALEVVEAERTPVERERGGPMLSSSPGGPPKTVRNEAAPDQAVSAEARVLVDDLRSSYDAFRNAWRPFYKRLAARLDSHPAPARPQIIRLVVNEFPAIVEEPDFQKLVAGYGIVPTDLRPAGPLRDEDVALQVLKELADWYHTPQLLVGRDAIVGFAQKIQDALDALFAGYVPLRNGLRNFESQFEVNQQQPASGATGVAHAQTQLEVGSRALDWTDSGDSAHAFRSLFADLMIHNMSMISGVMKGAAALVRQLSPQAITESFLEAKRAGRTGVAFGIFRYRELWRALEHRHRDLVKEENETFTLLFGREFAATYQQFFSAAAAEQKAELAPPRPPPRVPAPPPRRPRAEPAPVEKTPENHGAPPPRKQGPTGTVVVPRVPAPAPNAGPMLTNGAPPRNERS